MNLQKDNSERILAIDYGEKRIGTAITDPLQMFSIPLSTLPNDKKLWQNLGEILDNYNIVKIICGYPVNEDGTKSKMALKVEKFAADFESKFRKTVVLFDERYSSSIAWEHIMESVHSKKKRRDKSLIDMRAAAVILSDYINNKR